MKLLIKTITLQNFKGIYSKEISLNGNTVISGKNGVGKSTIATAFYWVFGDCEYGLGKNPQICPLGMDEISPCVGIVLDIDGKEITVEKIQKRTVKERDGKKTISINNSYEVNSISYGERDFKAKMNEYGFDFDLFLPLSHPNVFTSQKADEMRKILFKMVPNMDDKYLVEHTEGANDILAMLDTYSLDEISAMQKQTIRKIGEVYGKKGEILDAKVDGLAMSKVDIDVAELELQRNAIKEQLAQATASVDEKQKAASDLSNKLMQLNFDLTASRKEDIADVQKKREYLNEKKNKALIEQGKLSAFASRIGSQKKQAQEDLAKLKAKKDKFGKEWQEVKAETMAEDSTICPTCKQPFPAEKIAEMKKIFENSKASRLADIEKCGFQVKEDIEKIENSIPDIENSLNKAKEDLAKVTDDYKNFSTELGKLPNDSDIPKSEKTLELEKAISEMENKFSSLSDDDYGSKKEAVTSLQMQLEEINKKIGQADRNVEIDEQIADLQKKKIEYEQAKANAEKILHELDFVSMNRNNLMQNSINDHFKLVKFELWKSLKNGEYKECCIPKDLNGKELGVETNTALEIKCKLDIVEGLQNFYGQHYPIFLDNAECLDSSQKIELDTQLIMLKVSDGDLEVR